MKAGRELDALVAEKIMGFTAGSCPDGAPFWITPTSHMRVHWDPSTDIADTWEVVEKMRETHQTAFVLGVNAFAAQFSAWFNNGIWALGMRQNACPEMEDSMCLGVATADTAPLAICLAALKAVGVEIT